jgi:tRNA modification GTPase
VSVLRISGPHARDVALSLAGELPLPRVATLRELHDKSGALLDKALVLWFPAPASFTGEDVVELHVHGGRAVVAGVLEGCLEIAGVSLAKPGEFTRRAFENGKMDLSAAEGLADLIEAETIDGALAREVAAWRDVIIDALADAEGDIDFPDEDLPPGLTGRARTRIGSLRERLWQRVKESDRAFRVRDGFRVAIIGAPNAGKSSLLNVLAKREAAIVSPLAGTTRDVIEVRLVLAGAVVFLADTAGLRETSDDIESQGVTRALAEADEADLRLGVIASQEERDALIPLMGRDDIWILAKSDQIDWPQPRAWEERVSSKTGYGLQELEERLARLAQIDLATLEAAPLTRLRHKEATILTIAALDRALLAPGHHGELIAEDLRLAARHLGQIIGRVDMEDVLDRLFSQFCIGK